MAVRIRDVAEYSGVSVSTVSRVLNDHPDVSEAVRAKVLSAVEALHYVPNSSARDLVLPQSDTIGIVVRGVENPFFTALIHGAEQAAHQSGHTVVLHLIGSEDDELTAAAGLIRSKKLKGLILLGGRFDYAPEQTAALGVPFVCCSFTNSFGTLSRDAYSSVSVDDRMEAYKAVKLLLERGHKRIAVLLDSIHDRSISELRYRGYCQALEEAGLPLDPALVVETVDFTMQAAYEGICRLQRSGAEFTAIFAIADAMAIAAIKALSDNGRSVPERCSVVAIDGIDLSNYTVPTLTTLIQPKEIMGAEAVRILLDVADHRAEHQHVRLGTTLRAGGSVAAVS